MWISIYVKSSEKRKILNTEENTSIRNGLFSNTVKTKGEFLRKSYPRHEDEITKRNQRRYILLFYGILYTWIPEIRSFVDENNLSDQIPERK